ncbi:hypothetical protein BGW37DRAFT_492938 [Umbelopsis sp. PMI_123]|nr:hypothetical protein BGW37DRAFT_492938 [Umbelopsis sp. PMI_123]
MKLKFSDIFDEWFIQKPSLWKKVIKATIGYEICNILCFVPQVAQALGPVPYLLPLGALFFHAGTTIGCQIEQIWLNFCMLLLSAIWCGLFGYLITLYNRARIIYGVPLYDNGGSVIAAIAFYISVFAIAYYRLKYPRLFTPAWQAFILPFFNLTKQLDATSYNIVFLLTIIYPQLIGGGIALVINIVIWPETAAKNFDESLYNAFCSTKTVLKSIQNSFMLDENTINNNSDILVMKKAKDNLLGEMSRLRKAAAEAKYELVVSHYSADWYRSTTDSLEKIASILASTCLAVEQERKSFNANRLASSLGIARSNDCYISTGVPAVVRTRESEESLYQQHLRRRQSTSSTEYLNYPTSPYSTVQRIDYKLLPVIQHSINPHINAYMSICLRCFYAIHYRLTVNKLFSSHVKPVAETNEDEDLASCLTNDLQTLMATALGEFKQVESIIQDGVDRHKSHPREEHFLVYTFVFTLLECGYEILKLDQYTKDLLSKRTKYPNIWIPNVSLKKLLTKTSRLAKGSASPAAQAIMENQDAIVLQDLRRTASRMRHDVETQSNREQDDDLSDIEKDYEIPLQNAPGRYWWNRGMLALTRWFQYGPTQYAFKFSITMEILALIAWLPVPGLNTWYTDNHGQWALLSAMVIFNFTVGSTLLQSGFRIAATIIGALWGYIALLAAHRTNPYVLSVMILIFAVPFWFIFLGSKYPRIGTISLLTLVVIINTGYQDLYNETTFEVVWKRTVTAIIAVLVVMAVSYLIWPIWAREEMRKELAMLLMDTGIYYFQVASLACHFDTKSQRWQTTFQETEQAAKSLQKRLDTVAELFALSSSEPRLTKAAFPREVYASIIDHERNILFWISHMKRSQTFITEVVRDKIMTPVNQHRKEMAAVVHLYLFTLAGSLRNKAALPASLPSAEISRQRLQERLTEIWLQVQKYRDIREEEIEEQEADVSATATQPVNSGALPNNESQMYWQTYAAGPVQVVIEEEAIGELIVKLMGQHVFRVAEKNWARI